MYQNQRGFSTVIIIVIAVLAIGAGTATYIATEGFGTRNSEDIVRSETGAGDDMETAEELTENESRETVRRILAGGSGQIECTFDLNTQAEPNAKGKSYVAGRDKIRVDVNFADGGYMSSLVLGDTGYLWGSDGEKGVIIPATEQIREVEADLDSEEVSNLRCKNVSSLNESLFRVPADVEFEEF